MKRFLAALSVCGVAAVVGAADTSCTYRVPTQGITDQMESGRCWLFSTLNILRADMIGRYALRI